ncbi:deoxyribonuclease IV [Peptoniphilus sp. KCTC 25270]|uniref:deoxyribonuclease IV n=1 Tax=Peptoniphilus sp. KCTC 25270 TaxID=2897414 RepID=UPI001E338498|nr:deoxyribonuclease IV [Peptoniphilus sp. KCTC 25270]MCD1147924.1 deoxyribonuclease IV [Peptoniphilus sp. KCTC 25270]
MKDEKRYIGCHMSLPKGFLWTAKKAQSIGGNTFQFFTRNPRGSKAKPLDLEEIKKYEEWRKTEDFGPLFAHGSYTMNLASAKEEVRTFAFETIKDDFLRLDHLPKDTIYVFHPGSHTGQGSQKGMDWIVQSLKELKPLMEGKKISLEGMSGKGTEIGRSFEELQGILQEVDSKDLGIVLDTAHLFGAGYDIVHDLDGVLEELDEKIGLEKVNGIHLNDSIAPFGSNKDRHGILGEGLIGMEALSRFVSHPKLKHLPMNLETPGEDEDHKKEISLLREALFHLQNN